MRKNSGVAMLCVVVVLILVFGISAAFLTLVISYGKLQDRMIRSDEAQIVCDAGLEKVRRAMVVYTRTGTWKWNDVIVYCKDISIDPIEIKSAIQSDRQTEAYQQQVSLLRDGGYTVYEAPIPQNSTSPDSNDPIFIGWNRPYGDVGQHSFHVVVRDNDDGDGNIYSDSDNRLIVTVTATLADGTQRQIEVILSDPLQTHPFPKLAAVVSHDDVGLLGNIEVDGRDWDVNNLAPIGLGVYGIIAKANITTGGSSAVGGNGLPPPPVGGGVAPGSIAPNYVPPLPTNPDQVLEFDPGTLRAIAQTQGTLFTIQDEYDNFLASNGGNIPGGSIVYLEFSPEPPTNLGNAMQNTPSILVIHDSTSSTVAKNLHGQFKGAILVDSIDKVNAGTMILGSVYCFSPINPDTFGNGNSTIRYSSAVLNALPTTRLDYLLVEGYRRLK